MQGRHWRLEKVNFPSEEVKDAVENLQCPGDLDERKHETRGSCSYTEYTSNVRSR